MRLQYGMRFGVLLMLGALPVLAQPEVSGETKQLATLRYIDVAEGSGPAAGPGMRYTVHYTGWLRDGTKFDSSRDRNDPIRFVQGRRQVIAGWEAGFEGMKTGGRRRLFIPYALAYGERGSGPIPPKAELIFDIELLAVESVPELLPAADLLLPFTELEKKVLALARAVPEEKYLWRPIEGVRTFGEVLLHIANGNFQLLRVATGAKPEAERQAQSKDEIIALLNESFAAIRKSMESARAGGLLRDVDYFGTPTTVRGVYASLDTHIAEHLGQAIVYCRINNIIPPWSR